MEFRVLGPVEARIGGRAVALGPARQRCVLAALLVDAGHVVLVDQLVDRVWGGKPPYRVRGTLHSYLSRLRKVLDAKITQQSGGYVIAIEPEAVDLHLFRRLGNEARSADDQRAAALLEQALDLWRGEAFAGLDGPWVADARAALDRERRAAELDHAEVALRLGRHAELLPALSTSAGENPLDERLAGLLMLALYRSGRQADAQAHYQLTRRRLADELGADPSTTLRQLHHQILTADPALSPRERAKQVAVPRQLPPAPGSFVGREPELDRLTSLGAVSAVRGAGGIGKTWLVLHWAYRNLHRFPDGQLHVNLRGFDPSGKPVKPEAAVRGFLDALGVEASAVPVDPDAQAALYRSAVAGRRMLVVLDNARDTNQVVPLLPGSPTCTVLVTSRNTLAGLVTTQGATPVAVDVLDHDDAVALLGRHLGNRVAAEPDAVAELVRRCAGLPLALGIVAGRAATQPDLSLAALAGELRDHAGRLDALDTGESALNLRAVFSWSFDALSPHAQTLFGLLGLVPGPDFSLHAAASLVALPVSRTAVLLRELESAHLVQQPTAGRYRTHDLLRLYAAELAGQDDEALRRLVGHHAHTAHAADRVLTQSRPAIDVPEPAPQVVITPFADQAAGLDWFAAEHANLVATQVLAAERGWHAEAWLLAWSVHTHHWRSGELHDNLAMWRIGVRACEHTGEERNLVVADRLLAYAAERLGEHDEAIRHFERGLAVAKRIGDLRGEAEVLRAMAWACERRGEVRLALDHATPALELYRRIGEPAWEAWTLNQIGWYEAKLGEYEQARVHCESALELYQVHAEQQGEANTLDSLGYIAHHTGRYTEAIAYYERSLVLWREAGHSYLEAETLDHLAVTHVALGRTDRARATWRRALELFEAQHRTAAADRVTAQLNDL